ncbi:hypothetical protein LIER_17982 [Lithospermum erythrorhizon]|uniref:Uncharacterized protein n=1 Tax=Lithospermum erythrorhizon TaxID=34254 RepID=A0AAV3QGG6_LITER
MVGKGRLWGEADESGNSRVGSGEVSNRFITDPVGLSGGIVVMWKRDEDVQIVQASECFRNYHLSSTGADHCPILLYMEAQIERGQQRFVFSMVDGWVKRGVRMSYGTLGAKKCRDVDSLRWEEVLNLERELDVAWGEEEQYWAQRAKFNQLKEGERNTKFFHAL